MCSLAHKGHANLTSSSPSASISLANFMSAIHGIDYQSLLQRPSATLLCVMHYDNCAHRSTLEQLCMIIATQHYGIIFQWHGLRQS